MVREATRVDISAMPEVSRLVEAAERGNTTLTLQRGDQVVAVLVPRRGRRGTSPHTALTPDQRAAFLSSAGGWKGLLDVEQFKRDIRASRGSRRPPVEL